MVDRNFFHPNLLFFMISSRCSKTIVFHQRWPSGWPFRTAEPLSLSILSPFLTQPGCQAMVSKALDQHPGGLCHSICGASAQLATAAFGRVWQDAARQKNRWKPWNLWHFNNRGDDENPLMFNFCWRCCPSTFIILSFFCHPDYSQVCVSWVTGFLNPRIPSFGIQFSTWDTVYIDHSLTYKYGAKVTKWWSLVGKIRKVPVFMGKLRI